MNDVGLVNTHATETSAWEGFDATNGKPVFVDGPYGNPSQAKASAQSLAGVEMETSGGSLYVVTAALTSHLDFQVNAVAKCLAQASGTGTLSF